MTSPTSSLVPPVGGGVARSIARRAVDLARDGSLPVDVVTDHLQRLARGRRPPLEDALDVLAGQPDAADVVCARLLVRQAITTLPAAESRRAAESLPAG